MTNEIQIGDIVSIDNSNHLEIVSAFDGDVVLVKPLGYDVHYTRHFKLSSCKPATDAQICHYLAEQVKNSYLHKLSNEV